MARPSWLLKTDKGPKSHVRYHSADAIRARAAAALPRDRTPGEAGGALGLSLAAAIGYKVSLIRRPYLGEGRRLTGSTRSSPLEAFLVSLSTVAVAEIGDRTQFLTLMLAARFRRPWPILAGVLCATLANHGLAALIGAHLGRLLKPWVRDGAVGVSLVLMALWSLKSETLKAHSAGLGRAGAFPATLATFFVAELGDKTQIATMALAAAYSNLVVVVAGTTCGMLIANAPVVFLGQWFSERLPVKAIHYVAGLVFLVLGVVFLVRAAFLWR